MNSEVGMDTSKKYLIVKVNDHLKPYKELDDEAYEDLKNAALALEAFNYLTFLSNSYVKAKEDFLAYDFSQFNVREVDMFNMFLIALEAMSTNRNLWEAYLKRKYEKDSEIYPLDETNPNKKSCFGIKDSECFDKDILFVVSKILRDMISHHCKPYSEIMYNDDMSRRFIITRDDLLELGHPNKAEQKYISDSKYDYYDVVEVIKHAFEVTDEINVYMLNLILQKEWLRFITARYKVIDHIGTDWQGAFLIKPNPKYPEEHLLYLSQTDISKNAMDSIRSIAARSLFDKK